MFVSIMFQQPDCCLWICSVLAKIEYENEKPVQQSFPPRIQTIKRNPVIVRDSHGHHSYNAPTTSATQVVQNQAQSQGGTINRYVTSKPVPSVHQKLVPSGKNKFLFGFIFKAFIYETIFGAFYNH